MENNYLAFAWNEQSAHADADANAQISRFLAQPRKSSLLFAAGGLRVFGLSGRRGHSCKHVLLPNSAGVVVGDIFSKGSTPIPEILAKACRHNRPFDFLASQAWGRYVAFLAGQGEVVCAAMRDPSGQLKLFKRRWQSGVRTFFSEAGDAFTGSDATSVDWNSIAEYLIAPLGIRTSTGFSEVQELLPGNSAQVRYDHSDGIDVHWRARNFALDRLTDLEEAKREARSAIQNCVDAVSSISERSILSLSGGLDSTALLAALVRSPQAERLTCVNQYTRSTSGDERDYARLAARHAQRPLEEVPLSLANESVERIVNSAPLTTKPSWFLLATYLIPPQNQFMRALGGDFLWMGDGGDQVFFAQRNMTPARDCRLDRGISRELLSAISDAAKVSRNSWWAATRAAFKRQDVDSALRLEAMWAPYLAESSTKSNVSHTIAHPWVQDWTDLPPGKLRQMFISSLSLDCDEFDRLRDFRLIRAYVSQPIVETLFRIPTYLLCKGGVLRSFERYLFAGEIPEEIRVRTSKGSIGQDAGRMLTLAENRNFFRSFLLSGRLAERGLLKTHELEKRLASDNSLSVNDLGALVACMTAEGWLQKVDSVLGRTNVVHQIRLANHA